MAKNAICHIEWKVTDLDRAQRFFGGLFDWTFRQFGDSMVVFGLGEQHIGGFEKADTINPGSSPSVWIEADDLDAYCAKAIELGGTIKNAKHAVPGVGHSAQICDHDGNKIGLVQFG